MTDLIQARNATASAAYVLAALATVTVISGIITALVMSEALLLTTIVLLVATAITADVVFERHQRVRELEAQARWSA